jgi:hypothetical protein
MDPDVKNEVEQQTDRSRDDFFPEHPSERSGIP